MGLVEQRIIDVLKENGGECYQSAIVNQSGFSKSRVSEILSILEKKGTIQRFALGKNLRVELTGKQVPLEKARSASRVTLGFTRSAEYAFLPRFANIVKASLGKTIEFRIYRNGIEVTRDLSRGRIDMGIAPILTLFESHSLGSPFTIVAPSGAGGSSIIERRQSVKTRNVGRGSTHLTRKSRLSEGPVGTTKLSTMELLVRSSMNAGIISPSRETDYASSPAEIVAALVRGQVDAISIWEPYATLLLKRSPESFRRLTRYSEVGEHVCCALGVGNHLDSKLSKKTRAAFKFAIQEFDSSRESCLPSYSALTGYDQKTLREVSPEYHYPEDIDPRVVANQFERAGIVIPKPSAIREALKDID